MKPSNLIVDDPHWDIECFPGSCGASIVIRLEAEYTAQQNIERSVKNRYPSFNHKHPITIVGRLSDQIRHDWDSYNRAPLNAAFGAGLDDMYLDPEHIFFATDNLRGTGDVHNGAFSTRNFIQWLKDNDLVNITESPLAREYLQGWSFTLKRRNAYNMLRRCRSTYVRWNNKLAKLSEETRDNDDVD